jgi:hypothetical protein
MVAPAPDRGRRETTMSDDAKQVTDAKQATGANEAASMQEAGFDYGFEAELFPTRSRKARRQPVGYKRFARAADAIRFAIEDLPPDLLIGAYMEVNEQRFDGDGIRRLYESPDYPLPRRGTPV